MKKLKAMISALLFLLVLAYALAFALNNSGDLTLDFLVGDPISWPAALWLGCALLLGVVLGVVSGMVLHARHKLHIHRLSKELNETQQRLNKLV